MKNIKGKLILRLMCLLLAIVTVASMISCSMWRDIWERKDGADVNSDLLVIPGSGGPEDTFVAFEGAVEYTGEPHEGTDIYYVGTGDNRDKIIVIDAGHQARGDGEQEPIGPGAEETKNKVSWGADGAYSGAEHALNLEVALLLRDELMARGYSVVMIRETADVNISNKERADIANKYSAAAYVRIHANYYDDLTMNGAMTICQSSRNPYPDCVAVYEESRLLSELLLQTFSKATGMYQREVSERDDMAGTNWSKVPTTIVEMGFLSNKSDDMLMATKYFKEQAAEGLADGLEIYFVHLEAQFEEESIYSNGEADVNAAEPQG